MSSFLRALQIVSVVGTWSASALADGRVTADELLRLGIAIAGILGVPTDFNVNGPNPFLAADKADG